MIFIWATILVLGVLIFVHELGHYLAARSVGVRVERFSIGFPPRFLSCKSVDGGWDVRVFFYRLYQAKISWGPVFETHISTPGRIGSTTEYVLALVPLGGYVKMAGVIDESMDTEITHSPDELTSKPFWAKLWVLSAGVIMNILTAFILFAGIAYVQGSPEVIDKPVISELQPGMPAQNAGLEPGDRITAVNDESVTSWVELQSVINKIPDTPITITLLRGSEEMEFSFTTSHYIGPIDHGVDTLGVIGIIQEHVYHPITIGQAIVSGYIGTLNSFGLIFLTFEMLGNGSASMKDLGGPVMIAQLAGQSAQAGWIPLLTFMALISVNLGFINILPVPGLDGGHILIILIESILRRPLSIKARITIQQVGMVFLLLLMGTVMFNDISRLLN
ncbi:MAG: RIP metalloprotease RseP [Candidatus Neomarinimicrobiota bacterium]|nr:RIP metalloprotease RseP [Candidatus Neomarinimicrobiota bacterium]